MSDVVVVARELYGLGLAEFVAERDRRAKAARADGDRGLAQAVKALRKPSVAAWAANMLARRRSEVLDDVVRVGEELRTAQAALDRARMRELDRERRRVLRDVVAAARAVGDELGQHVGEAAAGELDTMVRAAMVDPRAAQALLSGLLVATMEATGLGAVDLDGALAVPGVVPDADAVDDLVEVGGRGGGDAGGRPGRPGRPGAARAGEAARARGDEAADDDEGKAAEPEEDDAGAETGARGPGRPGRRAGKDRRRGGGPRAEEDGAASDGDAAEEGDEPAAAEPPAGTRSGTRSRTLADEHRRTRARERAQAARDRAEAREATTTEELREAEERARTVQARILQLQAEIDELRRGIAEREHALDRAEDDLAAAQSRRDRASRRADDAREAADAAREELDALDVDA
ncbi:hypothetical protein [Georgenia faecalis]|uniref:Transposase n=1 Tax=Georgenia faecalis TaxID=2483799 RepID=A0ABV9DD63_9MICO|nr:hypothetical protein [Georgenia faecalis]